MSLIQKLNDWIKKDGYVSYENIKRICETGGLGKMYRITTAERRLRPSESPDIEAVEYKNYIRGYKYIGEPILEPTIVTRFSKVKNNQLSLV